MALSTCSGGDTESLDDEKAVEKKKDKKKKEKKKERSSSSGGGEEKKLMHKETLMFDSPELVDVIERLRSVITRSEKVDLPAFFQEMRMLQVSQDFDSKVCIHSKTANVHSTSPYVPVHAFVIGLAGSLGCWRSRECGEE